MPPNGPPIFKPGPVRTAGAFLFRFVRRRPGLSPNGPPIFKPGPVRTVGAFLFRFVRRRPGLSLYIALLLPWLLGSKDPAWATVAEIMLILAIPLLILSRIGGIVIGPFIFLGSRRQDRP